MKKIVNIFLALTMICTAILMTACGTTEKYWETTFEKTTQFVEKQENAFLFSHTPSLTYSIGIQEQIDHGVAAYSELKTNYFALLDNLMVMFRTHRVNLAISPVVKDKQTQNLFKEFNQQMDKMQNSINQLMQSKAYFEQHVTNNLEESASLQELKNYKRAFVDTINQALEFNKTFEQLYTHAYLAFPTSKITVYQTGLENLMATVASNRLLHSFVLYAFDNGDGTMASLLNTTAITKLNQIQSALAAPNYKENKLEIINSVVEYSQLFEIELDQYKQALNVVNLGKVRKDGVQAYLTQNPTHETYLNKIENFNQTIVVLYADKVLELIA